MNIYEKLQTCRVELQKANLKKTGKNSFAGYDYYELGDFLPQINELMDKHKLSSIVTFVTDTATLTIINTEDPKEQIIFTSPVADAQLKGCHPVQNLGAVQTYLRRYLYTNAFEIVEHDLLDATVGSEQEKKDKQDNKPTNNGNLSESQIKRLFAIAKKKGYDANSVKDVVLKKYKVTEIAKMTKAQYDEAVDGFEKLENK